MFRSQSQGTETQLGELRIFVREVKHKGRLIHRRLGLPLWSYTWLRLTPESSTDRFVKAFGLTEELQTGDNEFDQLIYVDPLHP